MSDLHSTLAKSHPKLERSRVWCTVCGFTRTVDVPTCLACGWPQCCGYTMTIDSPDALAALEARDE